MHCHAFVLTQKWPYIQAYSACVIMQDWMKIEVCAIEENHFETEGIVPKRQIMHWKVDNSLKTQSATVGMTEPSDHANSRVSRLVQKIPKYT